MKKYLKRSASGFTIIEVIIVLAIAGLIMLVVFLAVPQLQRNARDNSRRAIVTRLKSEIENYASNNQGTYPLSSVGTCSSGTTGEWGDFYGRYISGAGLNIKDPSTGVAVIGCTPATSASSTTSYLYTAGGVPATLPGKKGVIAVIPGASCSGENVAASSGTNSYALIIGLDRDSTRYCIDNG